MTERIKPTVDKTGLLRDLQKVSEALRGDAPRGQCLPDPIYWSLRFGARDGLRFLEKRKKEVSGK